MVFTIFATNPLFLGPIFISVYINKKYLWNQFILSCLPLFLPRLQCNLSGLREFKPSSISLGQASEGFTSTLQSPPSSLCSICRPPAFPHPVRGWINVWLWETCRWQMFTFIMHDFHVAVNFSEPAKSRKWFCTLCLFNEIVTLMEVRLNKMEMTVSICHFYNFFFLLQPVFTSSPSPSIYGAMQYSKSWDRQWREFC